MKHYITVTQNGKQILGSWFTTVINSKLNYLGATRIRQEFKIMEKRIEQEKPLRPFLNNGNISIHYSK
jgi:hypothetical protein